MRLLLKLILPLILFGVLFASYAQFIWLPRITDNALNNAKQDLQVQLDTIAEGLTSLLLENQLASIYANLDSLLEKNESWISIKLNNNSGDRLYPIEEPVNTVSDENVITIYQPIGFGKPHLGKLELKVNNSQVLSIINEQQKPLRSIFFTLIITFFILTVGVIWIFVLQPLLHLGRATNELKKGNFEVELPKIKRNEIGDLIANFAEMRNALKEEKEKTEESSKQLEIQNIELQREIEEREKAQKEAEELRSGLEQSIIDRTIELVHARDAADSANRAKSSFLAAMSHELRTPMNGVVGMLEILQNSQLSEDQHKIVDTIRDSAFALLSILNDILDFSKIEAGKLVIEKIPLSVTELVESVCSNLAPNISRKTLKLDLYVDPSIPSKIQSDPVRLRQILLNLLGNAIKFTGVHDEFQGKIGIRVERGGSESQGKVPIRFRIIDNGIGMSKATQSKLFKPFTQADLSTTRRFGGSGLGLSITRRLVEMLDGEINVISKEGVGSEFIVSFEPTILAGADTIDFLWGYNVLGVISDNTLSKTLKSYLEYLGASYSQVDNLHVAHQVILQDKPHIVILGDSWDVQDQINFIESINRDKSQSQISFLLLYPRFESQQLVKDPRLFWVETNPMLFTDLQKSLEDALHLEGERVGSEKILQKTNTIFSLKTETANPSARKILVAEDHVVNREVIQRQLDLLGYDVDVVDDGRQALKKYSLHQYDLLLTDCHMPEMDGYELTKAIRELESGSESRLPIIAITANAMQGEAERCYESGMDDFITKPVELKQLNKLLIRWIPDTSKNDQHAEIRNNESFALKDPHPKSKLIQECEDTTDDFDAGKLASMVGDDPEIIISLLNDYQDSSREISEELQHAWHHHDLDGISKLSHKLKSAARAVGASKLGDICETLQDANKTINENDLKQMIPVFFHEHEKIRAKVKAYIDQLTIRLTESSNNKTEV